MDVRTETCSNTMITTVTVGRPSGSIIAVKADNYGSNLSAVQASTIPSIFRYRLNKNIGSPVLDSFYFQFRSLSGNALFVVQTILLYLELNMKMGPSWIAISFVLVDPPGPGH